MSNHNQHGQINVLLIPLITAIVFLLVAIGFGGWAYSSRQDYKVNSDKKVAVAVAAAKEAESTAKDTAFAEELKKPLATYSGPSTFGSLVVKYPKNWSAYIDDVGQGNVPINAYFYPQIIPSLTASTTTFALRFQVVTDSYASIVAAYGQDAKQGKVTITPYNLPQVSTVIGVKIDGALSQSIKGTMIVLPVRDSTLKIWTENSLFADDFANLVLPNFEFSP